MTPVVVPQDLWDGDLEGAVSAWLFAEGDSVRAGDLIAEIMVEKTTFDLIAPAAGILHLRVAAEVPFKRGATIAEIA